MDSIGYIIVYFVVALSIIVFSFMAVTTRRILRAATYLLFVLVSTAIFYFQLGYQFLGAVQIAVYAGGIMALFVFAILLTTKPDEKAAVLDHHHRAIGIGISVLGGIALIWAVFNMPLAPNTCLSDIVLMGNSTPEIHEIGRAMVGTEKFHYLLPFEAVSILLLAAIIGGVTIARKR